MSAFVIHKARPVWVALFVFVLALAGASFGAAAFAADIKFPDLNNHRVVDQANILSDATEADLELKLKGLEDATSDQMVVVTVDSLQGQEIEDYGYQLGRHWGIGQDGTQANAQGEKLKDNGIILLVAPNERKVRIEVGYGLEPVMTDALSSIIIRNAILPAFKSGDYDGGVEAGVKAVIDQLSLERGVAIQKAQAAEQGQSTSGARHGLPFPVVLLIIIIFVLFSRGWLPWFLLGSLLGGGRGGGDWGGGGGWSGGGGGGGFSGGGGSFGGGGSSGSW